MPETAVVNLNTILDQVREDASTNGGLSDRFDRMIQQFLRIHPLYASRFSELWM